MYPDCLVNKKTTFLLKMLALKRIKMGGVWGRQKKKKKKKRTVEALGEITKEIEKE